MANWFYFNKSGEKIGPISVAALKALTQKGLITQETVIMNHTGRTALAGEVRGLTFPEAPAPSVAPDVPTPPLVVASSNDKVSPVKESIASNPFSASVPLTTGAVSIPLNGSTPNDAHERQMESPSIVTKEESCKKYAIKLERRGELKSKYPDPVVGTVGILDWLLSIFAVIFIVCVWVVPIFAGLFYIFLLLFGPLIAGILTLVIVIWLIKKDLNEKKLQNMEKQELQALNDELRPIFGKEMEEFAHVICSGTSPSDSICHKRGYVRPLEDRKYFSYTSREQHTPTLTLKDNDGTIVGTLEGQKEWRDVSRSSSYQLCECLNCGNKFTT